MIDQSSFTNVSIFDRYYLEALFGGMVYPDGTFVVDEIEGLIEHQKMFMEVVSDIRTENMFTYPILSYSLLKRDDITEEEKQEMLKTHNWNIFVDNDFARWCSDHNCEWNDSNFFMSDNVGTLSNCCFSSDTQVCVQSGSTMTQKSLYDLYEETKNMDGYPVVTLSRSMELVNARVIRLPKRKMYRLRIRYKWREDDGTVCGNGDFYVKVTDNHIFPTFGGTDKTVSSLTLADQLVFAQTYRDGRPVKEMPVDILEILPGIEYNDDYVYCLEMEDETDPYFVILPGLITHNCRLLSDTKKLDAFINSIGGTALSIGSEKVNTINLMRIALESDGDKTKFLEILRERTTLCCKVLDVVRHIITRNIQKGLLPNYTDGGIEMAKQYSTVGILGLYEVVEEFGLTYTDELGYTYYSDDGVGFASNIFNVINNVKDSFNTLKKHWIKVDTEDDQYKDLAIEYSFNCESVPGERAAVILCQKDNSLYERNDKFIYSNQWIPLSTKCTIQEKLRVSAILDAKCSGGAISHIGIESNFPDKDSAWDMLNKIALTGVIYFAFNTRINECKNHHGFVGTDICPVCGEPVFDTYQRIVGYLVPSRQYSKDRLREFKARQWFNYASELKDL